MTFLRPAGRFYIETATKSKRHLVLWAAGSGITPLMSMLRAILFLEPLSRVSLIYQNHHIDRIIFREQLQALYQKFRRRFGLWHYISQPAPGSPLIHRPGRISPEAVQGMLRVLPSMPPPSHYLCGPEGFRRTVRRGLEMGGIGGERIFEEAFVADATVLASQASLEGPMRAVRVTLGTETYQVKVPPGSTLLEAALQQGIDLPYSCKQGTCSTCMGQCLSGQVQMDRPEALLDFEMAQGKVLTCQTRPLSDDVHIRIGF
ncbi:MAG: oxidoreductase [Bacteroidetes bacterium]|nr:MAG: oxidoreductase [Bacteroidota bacterium]